MTVNHKVTGTASTIPAGLALGTAAAITVTILLSAVTAWLILRGTIPEDAVGYCAMAILPLSSGVGAAVAVGRIKRLRMQMGLAAAGLYYGCLLAAAALFFGGIYDGMGVTALMVLCGSLLVILLGSGQKNRAVCRRRKKKR